MKNNRIVLDAISSDPKALHDHAGTTGRMLITALDKAVAVQTSVVEKYIDHLREKNPNASTADLQHMLDNHFMYLATGTGASVGLTSALPGIGLMTGLAAVSTESMVFVDAAAFYTIASAHLRGVDIRNSERRRALILVTLIGSAGTALVDAAIGDLGTVRASPAKNHGSNRPFAFRHGADEGTKWQAVVSGYETPGQERA